jgi:hypothetical protein
MGKNEMISKRTIFLTFAIGLCVSPALAEPQELGQFSDWKVYRTNDQHGTVCFALAEPASHKPANVKRGDIYFMVSAWPGQKVVNEPSIVPGYPYNEKVKAVVEIGGDKFEFDTKNSDGGDGGAWMKSPNEEAKLLAAMRDGSKMIVKGTSRRGTLTTDEYSLKGISAALDKIASECGKTVS